MIYRCCHGNFGNILNKSADRVVGWDLLRGCCAYAVVSYHLLAWQEVADIHTIGFYGVYLFFVLSGASLTYSYLLKFDRQPTIKIYLQFLFVRYMRLLPLFAVVVLISLLWKIRSQGLTWHLLLQTGLNLSFAFGFTEPLLSSLVVGGWSLGIEFVFYLSFPLFFWLLTNPWRRWVALLTLTSLQLYWISCTVAHDGRSIIILSNYHQIPAFGAYFFGGCIIGWLYINERFTPSISPSLCLSGMAAALVVFVSSNTEDPAAALAGWRGPLLMALCFLLVWWAGLPSYGKLISRIANFAGDVTYGVYLLHPLLYFGLAFLVAPQVSWLDVKSGATFTALGIAIVVTFSASSIAWFSEKWFESPIRRWSRELKIMREF